MTIRPLMRLRRLEMIMLIPHTPCAFALPEGWAACIEFGYILCIDLNTVFHCCAHATLLARHRFGCPRPVLDLDSCIRGRDLSLPATASCSALSLLTHWRRDIHQRRDLCNWCSRSSGIPTLYLLPFTLRPDTPPPVPSPASHPPHPPSPSPS